MNKNQKLTLFFAIIILATAIVGGLFGARFLKKGTTAIIPAPTPPSSGVFSLLNPTTGEKIERGKTYSIKWIGTLAWIENPGVILSVSPTADVILYKDGQYKETIALVIQNNGLYNWQIRPDLPLGAGYSIKIRYTISANPHTVVHSESPAFEIYSSIPSIIVFAPNGPETLVEGSSYTIKWEANKLDTASLGIGVQKFDMNGESQGGIDIASVPSAQNSYLWKVSSNLNWQGVPVDPPPSPGPFQYKIYVTTPVGITPRAHDQSDNYFKISSSWCDGSDINKDGKVGLADLTIVGKNWQKTCQAPDWCSGADVDRSGRVDIVDQTTVGSQWGKTCSGG